MSDDLQKLRDQIDAIDDQLLTLINARAEVARRIGALKNGVVYRPEREAQVLRRVQQANQGPLSNERVGLLFREVMSACLALEKPLSVAYLGPSGTFTEGAAIKHFGHAAATVAHGSIDDVFRGVEAGRVDYGVVPVENSTEGSVGRTLDLLMQTSLKICGEVLLPIHQHLLSKQTELSEVRSVYSHRQSFAQCHEWLNQHLPNVERFIVESNAEGARRAAGIPGAAAIAGEAAGERYAMNRLAINIEDDPNNTTRFFIVGAHPVPPSGSDKTSLVVSSRNQPGAIHALLEPLAKYGVSMTKLESRPSRTAVWEYVFFIDIDGHQDDETTSPALEALRCKASFMKILGSYPRASL